MLLKINKRIIFVIVFTIFVIAVSAQEENNLLSDIIMEWTVNEGDLSEYRYSIDISNITTNLETSIMIYPNPSNSIVFVSNTEAHDIEIMLLDTSGKLLINKKSIHAESELDLSDLSNGVYLLKIKDSSNGHFNKKIIKM